MYNVSTWLKVQTAQSHYATCHKRRGLLASDLPLRGKVQMIMVLSLEITGENFPEIYLNLSGNSWYVINYINVNVNQQFPSPVLQSDAVK